MGVDLRVVRSWNATRTALEGCSEKTGEFSIRAPARLAAQPNADEAILHVQRDDKLARTAAEHLQFAVIRAVRDEWAGCFIQQTDDVDRPDAGQISFEVGLVAQSSR